MTLTLETDQMVSFKQGLTYRIKCLEDCYLVISQFEKMPDSCEKLFLSDLANINKDNKETILSLQICPNLKLFLELLSRYLEDGANCIHFHEIKMKELFWVLRFYYTKEQLSLMFSFLIGNNYNFRTLVLKHYTEVRFVKELAFACGYSLASFKREFDKEFKEPAGQWLQKQTVNLIKYKLLDDSIPLCDIADELKFSSLSHFSNYCKQKLGYTPAEYRIILKKNDNEKER